MAGCTNCKSKSGCDDRKGVMFHRIEEELTRLYPSRTWGEPDDLARFGAGVDERDGHALAEELASELRAATFYRPGGPEEYCDYIYVLCVGREPCLVQLRDGEVAMPAEVGAGEVIREQYLRVCLSHMARVAAVQQTAMSLEAGDGDLVVEVPRPGVYDAPLLRRFQRLVSILPAYGIAHLDFGEISAPPVGFTAGVYTSLYGTEPHTANYLFFPQPSTTKVSTLLEQRAP